MAEFFTDADLGIGSSGYIKPPRGVEPVERPLREQEAISQVAEADRQGRALSVTVPASQMGRIPTSRVLNGTPLEANSAFSDEDLGITVSPPELSSWDKTASLFKKNVANAAALGDMVLNLPAQLIGVGADLGARAAALGSGVDRRTGAQAGELGREIASPLMNPLQKLMEATGYGKDYEQSDVAGAFRTLSSWLDKGGEWIEKRTAGKLLKEDVSALINTAMAAGGVSGMKAVGDYASRKPGMDAKRNQAKINPQEQTPGGFFDSRTGQWMPPEAPRPAPPSRQLRGPVEKDITPLSDEEVGFGSSGESSKPLLLPDWARSLGVGAAAYGAAQLSGQDAQDSLVLGAAALAVKQKGGMWHPKAVNTLAEPLAGGRRMQRAVNDVPADPEIARLREETAAEYERGYVWATKASQNYLNKHMGTETDPLREIEIPFGEGVKKWGEVTDQIINDVPARALKKMYAESSQTQQPQQAPDWLHRVPDEEPIYALSRAYEDRMPGEATSAAKALSSYLSHVGDYLRQNVTPEKLPQFDLVRAVKETAANDARVAKLMEKEAAEAGKDLPVHKEYPDGFRWVELKLPERLTVEQAKGVRRDTFENAGWLQHERAQFEAIEKKGGNYTAIDAQGKAIQNTYTGESAVGKSPEEAYLAGQLAREGNQMGHCVGGYCEGVASGDSRIFSLRDAKGKSHVTIETIPPNRRVLTGSPEHFVQVKGGELLQRWNDIKASNDWNAEIKLSREIIGSPEYRAWLKQKPDNIVQIKGKQNRAPASIYLPYVQDFIKGGKWGEVGDLENTGLLPHRTASGGQDPYTYKPGTVDQTKIDLAPGYYTKEELHQANLKAGGELDPRFDPPPEAVAAEQEFRGGRQAGSIDPKLLATLAAVGLGAAAGALISDDPLSGAALGAAAAFALTHNPAMLKAPVKLLDNLGGAISTRIGNHSPAIQLRLRNMEMNRFTETASALSRAVPFMKGIGKLSGEEANALDRALLTNDRDAINAAMPEGMKPAFREVRSMLREIGQQLVGLGRFESLREDYFPRVVKDPAGLMGAVGTAERTRLESVLLRANEVSLKKNHRPLNDIETSAILNRELRSTFQSDSFQPGFARSRRIHEVTERLRPFYYTPADGLFRYLTSAVADIEKAKFFGRSAVNTDRGYLNLDASVGELTGREMREGRLTPEGAQEIEELLKARFGKGEQSPKQWLQSIRDYTYATLLAHPSSSVVQIGDVGNALTTQGFGPTLRAVGRKLTGRSELTRKDFGLVDHIAEELVGTQPLISSAKKIVTNTAVGATIGGLAFGPVGAAMGGTMGLARAMGTARFVSKAFKLVGFTAIDGFAKDVVFNAALTRLRSQAKTARGRALLAERYEPAFQEDFPKLLSDLQSGLSRESYPIRAAVFSELSNIQPVSKSEMSAAWLNHPDARLLWMLKSYTLKQFDLARTQGYNEIKKGGVANVSRGLYRLGKMAAILGVSGAAVSALQDWIRGRPADVTWGDVWDNVMKTYGWSQYVSGVAKREGPAKATATALAPPYKIIDDLVMEKPQAAAGIPVVGKVLYDHLLNGKERAEIAAAKRAKAKGEAVELSSEARAFREAEKERRRQARILKQLKEAH